MVRGEKRLRISIGRRKGCNLNVGFLCLCERIEVWMKEWERKGETEQGNAVKSLDPRMILGRQEKSPP